MAKASVFFGTTPVSQTRRGLKSLLIKPELQLRLPVYLLFVTVLFAIASWVVLQVAFDGLYEFAFEQENLAEHVGELFRHQVQLVIGLFSLLTIVYVLLTVGLSVAFLHKLIGPSIAFKRHINALSEGNYASRITLRQDDAFGGISIELNELAEVLEEKYASASQT